MICPQCDSASNKVTDSRPTGDYTRRRRRCEECQYSWLTVEVPISDGETETLGVGKLISEIVTLNKRWRQIAREVVRGLIARQALDDIGKDKAA